MAVCNITLAWMVGLRHLITPLWMRIISRNKSKFEFKKCFFFVSPQPGFLFFYRYAICIRQELGYCCVEYTVCPDDDALGFTLGVVDVMAKLEMDCATLDYVGIEGK